MKLTAIHFEILKHGAHGQSIRFVWRWTLRKGDTQSVTRQVNALLKAGLLKAAYYTGCEASANATDEGRALAKGHHNESQETRP